MKINTLRFCVLEEMVDITAKHINNTLKKKNELNSLKGERHNIQHNKTKNTLYILFVSDGWPNPDVF